MNKTTKKDAVLSFLGSDIEIQGSITFVHSIRIDGIINGDIISENGTIVVGQSAVVHGDIRVAAATIMGTVEGQITAKDRVNAFPPAIIKGDISAPVIGLEKGVAFSGNCEITPKRA